MKIADIQKIAKNMGINAGAKTAKKNFIRQIQIKEENYPCYDTGNNDCNQYGCSWREDCIK